MPPKKGKGKGKKEKKAATAPEYVPEKKLSENDKKFYTMQIQLLEKQYEKYQQRCTDLKDRQKVELDQVKTLEQDFEMLKYAKKQVEIKEEEIADLKDRLIGLGQAKELEKDMLQKQLNDLKNEIHDLRERYEAENSELRNQVADLEIFRAKQDSYLARRQQQQDTLQFRQEDHVKKLESIKKKDQTDRDRLIKDMVQKMNHVAADFRRASNKQMAETTKRTINENARIEQTVNDMEDVATRVHHENEQILDGNNHLNMGIQTLRQKEQQHAFQHATSAEIIQLLANMLQNQEEIIVKKQEQIAQVDIAERRIKELRSLIFNNEKNYPDIRQQNKSFDEKLDELNKLIAAATKEKAIILSNLRQAILLVTETLKIKDEDKSALVPIEQVGQTITPETTGNLFEQLYKILTSTEEIDVDEQQQSSNIDFNRSTLNIRDPGKRRDNLSYTIGDIGFVPRRDAVLLTNFDKMQQQVYPARERDTIRRAAKISVAVQTPGLGRGSFGSDVSLDRLGPFDNGINKSTREQFNRPTFGPKPRVPYAMSATNRIVQCLF
ncbi:unnamed protein product [Rotaria sp. Silwood2]|nr:unnamed protein product [Rotaria sp. Silwood2]CAF2546552.1 unnamed protein product [Rotaria sp. Silwood2]CAF3932324.1 unnamed protein product [Rotaria sp. Silwood2]CAF4026884.1 unnamed protein product [Rotaria sp. Silwood2]